jgi:transcriptional regulator with XRE-family HTH domain
MKSLKKRRSAEVRQSDECHLLRQLRLESGFSIREVGRRLGKSETYLRHIEKGRSNLPGEDKIKEILLCYSVSFRQFRKRIDSGQINRDPKEELLELVNYLDIETARTVLKLTKSLLN